MNSARIENLPSSPRILIVKLGAVGDVVHTLYALRALRRTFPDSRIDWVVEDKSAEGILGHPDLNEAIVFERRRIQAEKGLLAASRELFRVGLGLRKNRYDVAVDFQGLLKSGLLTLLSGARIRLGFAGLREGNFLFTNHRVRPGPEDTHAIQKYMALIAPLGVEKTPVEGVSISVKESDREPVDTFWPALGDGGPVVVLNPAASWQTKKWPVDRFARLADRLVRELGCRILVIWGPGERDLALSVLSAMSEKGTLAPPTGIKALAHLFDRAAVYVGGDTGPMHIAAAVGTPAIVLFGPSNPARVGPFDVPHRIVENHGMDCLHCWRRKCPDPRCMTEIPADRVFDAVGDLLSENADR